MEKQCLCHFFEKISRNGILSLDVYKCPVILTLDFKISFTEVKSKRMFNIVGNSLKDEAN